MKEIRAYVQPFVVGRLMQALVELPKFPGVSVSDCEGFGGDRIEAGTGFMQFAPKKRLEIFARDAEVEAIVAVIMEYAHTGRPGDGKLFVSEVLQCGKIRTGQLGKDIV